MPKSAGATAVPTKKAAIKKKVHKPKEKKPILQNLENRPKSSDTYLWCDYIELRCLSHADNRFSRDNLEELLSETVELAEDEDMGSEADEPSVELGEVPHVEAESDDEASEDSDEVAGITSVSLPRVDRYETRSADLFKNLAYRAEIFGDAYPFELSADCRELKLRDSSSVSRQLYLQLLLSSSLRLVPQTRWDEITEPFEELCKRIFECLMPAGWQVHRFGAKSAKRYTGLLANRLRKLAKDVRTTLQLKGSDFKAGDHGDGGLDIVAWHPLGNDSRIGIPISFAQCGCTAEEWSMKSLEPTPAAMPYLRTHHPWASYYFMPQDLVKAEGSKQEWQRKRYLRECIIIDRLRIMRLAAEYDVVEECLPKTRLADEVKLLAAA